MSKPYDFAEEIQFAAQSGFLTRKLWWRYFANGTDRWRFKMWRAMRERGLFRPHSSALAKSTLVLNPRNAVVLAISGGHWERPTFVGNLLHDEAVLTGLLELKRLGLIEGYLLEQQLRRAAFDLEDKARDNRDKFPDAVVRTKLGLKVSIEIELVAKSASRYREIIKRYAEQKKFDVVLYVVADRSIELILSGIAKTHAINGPALPIGFADLSTWSDSAGRLEIRVGDRKLSFEEFQRFWLKNTVQ